jgi:hypothetical protein
MVPRQYYGFLVEKKSILGALHRKKAYGTVQQHMSHGRVPYGVQFLMAPSELFGISGNAVTPSFSI